MYVLLNVVGECSGLRKIKPREFLGNYLWEKILILVTKCNPFFPLKLATLTYPRFLPGPRRNWPIFMMFFLETCNSIIQFQQLWIQPYPIKREKCKSENWQRERSLVIHKSILSLPCLIFVDFCFFQHLFFPSFIRPLIRRANPQPPRPHLLINLPMKQSKQQRRDYTFATSGLWQ